MEAPRPEVSVVVPSHGRGMRLCWLLNALEEQTLARDKVGAGRAVRHDRRHGGPGSPPPAGDRPGAMRACSSSPAPARPPAAQHRRREARAGLIAFTDDDCRPEPDWLEGLLTAANATPGRSFRARPAPTRSRRRSWRGPRGRARSRGPSRPVCPDLQHPLSAGRARQRRRLRRVAAPTRPGEDPDLAVRLSGARQRHTSAHRTRSSYHAVDEFSLAEAVRFNRRWESIPPPDEAPPRASRPARARARVLEAPARDAASRSGGSGSPPARALVRATRGAMGALCAPSPGLASDGPCEGRR